MYLSVNRIIYPVYNLGPGIRVAIWLQGCKILCKGCINPELHNRNKGKLVEVVTFVQTLSELTLNMDGITITGGEPFDQYEALVAFCSFFKHKTGKHIYVFSGYTLDELFEKFPDRLFLSAIDLLNAGPYVAELNENEYFRGSSNQKLYSFEPEIGDGSGEIKIAEVPFIVSSPQWSVGMGEEYEIFLSGIPGKNDMQVLKEKMNQSGINTIF